MTPPIDPTPTRGLGERLQKHILVVIAVLTVTLLGGIVAATTVHDRYFKNPSSSEFPALTTTDLDSLSIDKDVRNFVTVLGPEDVRTAEPTGLTGKTLTRYHWTTTRYDVTADVDQLSAVSGYSLTVFDSALTPKIPFTTSSLRVTPFAEVSQNQTRGQLTLFAITGAIPANTISPVYREKYSLLKPVDATIEVSLGGDRLDLARDMSDAQRVDDELIRHPNNEANCTDTQCIKSEANSFSDFRTKEAPSGFSITTSSVP